MRYGLISILMLPVALFFIMREPVIQDFLARSASVYLSEQLGTEILIGSLRLNVFLDVVVRDVLINDRKGQHLLQADKLELNVDKFSRRERILDVDKIFIDKAAFNMITYAGDTTSNLAFLVDYFSVDEKQKDTALPWQISIGKIKVYDTDFHLLNENKAGAYEAMDYSDLEVSDINMIIDRIRLDADTIFFDISNLEAYEKSGFMLRKLKGNFKLSPVGLTADHLKVITGNSELSMNLRFEYDAFRAFKNFVEEVRIETVIGNSFLNLYDIGYFAPVLFEMDNELEVSGTFSGPVNALRVRNFKFDYGDNTRMEANITLSGLPDVRETFSNFDIRELTTSVRDLERLRLPVRGGTIEVPEQLELFGKLVVKGYFTGFYNDFVSNAEFQTDIGRVLTDVSLKQNPRSDSVFYQGHLIARNFEMGKFLSAEGYLGSLDLDAQIRGSGLTADDIKVNLDGHIDSMVFINDRFDSIRIAGDLANKKFTGSLKVNDDKLFLDFNGQVNFQGEVPFFDFYADINKARIAQLDILEADTSMVLSTMLTVRFSGTDIDEMEGLIRMDSTYYVQGVDEYYMEALDLIVSRDTSKAKYIRLNSDFLNAEVYGHFLFKELFPSVSLYMDNYLPSLGFPVEDIRDTLHAQDINFNFFFKKTAPLTSLFIPQFYIADSATLAGSYNSTQNHIELAAHVDTARFGGIRYDNWFLESFSDTSVITLRTGSSEIVFREVDENDSLSLGIDSTVFTARLSRDSLKFDIHWDDSEHIDWNVGHVQGYLDFVDFPRIEARISKARIKVNDTTWRIGRNNYFVIDTSSFSIRDFLIKSHDQEFLADGVISGSSSDTLDLLFRNWKFSNFDVLFLSEDVDFDGEINGGIHLSGLYGRPSLLADLSIRELYFNKVRMGQMNVISTIDERSDAVHTELEILKNPKIPDTRTLHLAGDYYPERSKNNLDFRLSLSNFMLDPFNPFFSGIFSGLEGFGAGEVEIGGELSSPRLSGSVHLMRAGMKVNYLNVAYDFAHEVDIDENGFHFNNMVLYDSLGNTAGLNGSISHERFRDFRLDIEIQPEDLVVMNTSGDQNDLIYGDAFGSGVVNIYGPFDNIRMDINAISEKGTRIFIPITYESGLYERDYIVFVNTADTVEEKESYNVNLTGLDMNMEITATPDAEVQLFLPSDMGNIKARGRGNLNMKVEPTGEFNINGDYEISEGTFLFTLRNLVNRRFDILQGGTISWTGSPYDAEINVRGLYRVKTSLEGLGLQVDTTAGYTRRVTVNCIVELRNQLFDPDIHFSINIPNIDDQTRQVVYSVLDTTNEAMMNQQMISLLVLGSFSYRTRTFEQSSYRLLSNQLSNWLSQISQDVDIGVNYRPGDQISQEEIEVALSTQLFNERLVIDGNFGVVGNPESNNASNIVGDVNVEVKLTEDGRFRVKAFNRSNYNSIYDVTTFDNIAPYTQGIGIFYRKEFNTFGELFRRKKKDTGAQNPGDLQ